MTHRTAVIALTAALLVTAPNTAHATASDNGDGGVGVSTSPGWDSAAKHTVDLARRGSRVQLDVPVPGWCGSRTGTPASLPAVCR